MSTSQAPGPEQIARLHCARDALTLRTVHGEVHRRWEAAAGAELAPEIWTRAAQDCRREAALAGHLEGVRAVEVSGDLEVHVITDSAGAPLRPAFCGADPRMEPDAGWLIGQLPGGAAEWTQLTGAVPDAGRLIARCSWMHRTATEPWAQVGRLCSLPEWLAGALSGTRVGITAEMAAASGFWSIRGGEYSRLICAIIDADRALEATLAPVTSDPAGALGTWDDLELHWA